MGFLLCLVLGKSKLTLLSWFSERLGSSLQALDVLETSTSSLCPSVSPCPLQEWLGVTAAPLFPSYSPRGTGSAGGTCEMSLDANFSGISSCYKQVWNSVSHRFLTISVKLHFTCCRWASMLVAEGFLGRAVSSELMFLEPKLEWFHAWCCHKIRLSAWVLQCYLHLTLVVICDKEFGLNWRFFLRVVCFSMSREMVLLCWLLQGLRWEGNTGGPPTEFRLGKNS